MAGERFVVLGLAPVRSAWFRDVAKWATAAAIPVDFLKTVSVAEVRARLRSGRGISALLIDDGVVGLDRDLIDLAADVGCAVIVVDSGRTSRTWSELGVAGVLPRELGRGELVELLSHVAAPIARVDGPVALERVATDDARGGGWRGSLVAVTGAPGAGRSTIAMALAQGFARDPRDADLVCLADLSLDADQGMLHDCPDVVPGVLELVDANRSGMPSTEETRSLTWAVEGRGYQLLLGLRRHRDWTALRPRAVEASLDGLRRCFRVTVADVDPDVEGEDECGSIDVEERNLLARAAARHADLVVVVGNATLTGVHHLLRVVHDLRAIGVREERLLPLVNRSPRSPRARAEVTAAIASLLSDNSGVPSPAFAPDRRQLDDALRAAMPLPASLADSVTTPVRRLLGQADASADSAGKGVSSEPIPVAPGSLGLAWTEDGQ